MSLDSLDRMIAFAVDQTVDTPSPGDVGVLQQGLSLPGAPVPTQDFRLNPSFEAGGIISAPPGVGSISAQDIDQEAQRIISENPEQMLQIKQAVAQALQSGELTPQELNLIIQLATAAAQNPQLWPQLREFAIKQGLAGPNDLSAEYDQGLVFAIMLAAKAVQAQGQPQGQVPLQAQPQGQPQGQVPLQAQPQAQGQSSVGSFQLGGPLPTDSNNVDGSIPISAHEGEFVIPAEVVRRKGTDFFQKMIAPGGN